MTVGEVFARDCTEALGKMKKRMAKERKKAGDTVEWAAERTMRVARAAIGRAKTAATPTQWERGTVTGHEEAMTRVLGAAYQAPPRRADGRKQMEASIGRMTQQISGKAGRTWREWSAKSKAAREWLETRETQMGWMQRVFKAWETGHRWHQGGWDGERTEGEEEATDEESEEGIGESWERLRYAIIRRKGGARTQEESERRADRAEQVGDARVRDAWEGQEALGFVVSHTTTEGRVFTDRMQVTKDA